MTTPTPGTIPALPPYQPAALTITGQEALEIVTSLTATSAISASMLLTDVVGKAPSVMTVANPATGDLIAFFQSASNLPYACQVGDLGVPAGNVPTGGGTGTILNKISGVNFNAGWSTIAQFVSVGTGLATSGSATALTIAVTGPLTPTTYTANGVLYGNGTGALGVTNWGTTAYALTGNGSALAPTFAILTVPGGGIGTTALSSHGVPTAQGSSAFGVAAATTAGYPFVANGSTTDPSFQALALNTANVTNQLPVTFGGIGTSTLSSHGVPIAAGSAALQVVGATTAGLVFTSQGSTSNPTWTTPIVGWGLNSNAGTVSIATTNPAHGLDAPINLGLSAAISSGTLTINFLNNAGSNPSAASPILVGFQNTNATTATPAWSTINSALSITTFSTGATLGASNSSVPFRFWITLFYQNATQVMPALINCSNTAQIFSLMENNLATTVGIGSASVTAGVFYSPNGTTVGNAPFRIAGYVEYGGGLPTAGSYSSAPTALKVYSSGMKKPGDIVQSVDVVAAAATVSFTTVLASTNVSNTITPTATPNPIKYNLAVSTLNNGPATTMFAIVGQLYRNGSAIGTLGRSVSNSSQGQTMGILGLDAPGTTGAVTYLLRTVTSGSTGTVPATTGDIPGLSLMEIMG